MCSELFLYHRPLCGEWSKEECNGYPNWTHRRAWSEKRFGEHERGHDATKNREPPLVGTQLRKKLRMLLYSSVSCLVQGVQEVSNMDSYVQGFMGSVRRRKREVSESELESKHLLHESVFPQILASPGA